VLRSVAFQLNFVRVFRTADQGVERGIYGHNKGAAGLALGHMFTPIVNNSRVSSGENSAAFISHRLAGSFWLIREGWAQPSIRSHLLPEQKHMYEGRCRRAVAGTAG
jgi:hypothetical protein